MRRLAVALLALLALSATAARSDPGARAVRAWLASHARPLVSDDPDRQGPDLGAVAAVVGQARVAAFGEATHGSREFFRMKSRVFRHLVETQGFTAFAIEANAAEAEAIDRYVHGAAGDPGQLLSAFGFWTWDTEELLALIEWVRAWNGAHPDRTVSFYGVDIQYAPANLALAFAGRDDSGIRCGPPPDAFAAYRAAASDIGAGYRFTSSRSRAEAAGLREAARSLFECYEDHEQEMAGRIGRSSWARGRTAALAAAWYFVMEANHRDLRFTALRQDYDARDRAMADLVEDALAREGPHGRLFVWAHNAHVSRVSFTEGRQTMGRYLSEELGADYVAVGFAFDQGQFQAINPDPAARPRLQAMSVGPQPAGSSEALLRAGPRPSYVIDLRQIDAGTPAYRWFAQPRALFWTGANFSPALLAKHAPISLRASFDALIFIHQTTRARPTANSRRKQGLPDG